MRKQYDDFTQLKLKDMSKSISDMTYKYINPETNSPTKVPSAHYEKILNQVTEKYMADITSKQFLTIMYNQLSSLKKEDEKYFQQALLCLDLNLNPKDLRVDEQIALEYTYEFINQKKAVERKEYHFLSDDIIDAYEDSKNDSRLQANVVRESNRYDDIDNKSSRNYDEWDR